MHDQFISNKGLGDFSTGLGYLDGLGDRKLFKGDKGDDVKELQSRLVSFFITQGERALPKYGADGDYGNETVDWVKKFQAQKGMSQTGIADDAVYKALGISGGGTKTTLPLKKGFDFKASNMTKFGIPVALLGAGLFFMMRRRGRA